MAYKTDGSSHNDEIKNEQERVCRNDQHLSPMAQMARQLYQTCLKSLHKSSSEAEQEFKQDMEVVKEKAKKLRSQQR